MTKFISKELLQLNKQKDIIKAYLTNGELSLERRIKYDLDLSYIKGRIKSLLDIEKAWLEGELE